MPAVMSFILMMTVYLCGFLLGPLIIVFISILVLIISLEAYSLRKGQRKGIYSFVFTILLLCYVMFWLVSNGIYNVNNVITQDIKGINEYKVISVKDKLSGSSDITLYSKKTGYVLYKCDVEERPALNSDVKILGTLTIPEDPSNPGQFDYARYLHKKGISYLYKNDAHVVESNPDFIGKTIDSINLHFYSLRSNIVNRFSEYKEITAAMFFGDTSLIDSELSDSFKFANCYHLLAVSGTHFAGFLITITYLLDKIKNKRNKAVIYIVLCFFICTMTGWTESVTRACFISICSFYSKDKLSGLSLSVILMVISNPLLLIQDGFLMSYSIFLSIILCSRKISSRLMFLGRFISEKRIGTIAMVVSCQIGMMPFWYKINPRLGLTLIIFQFIVSTLAQFACEIFIPCVVLSYVSDSFLLPIKILVNLITILVKKVSEMPFALYAGSILKLGYFLLFFVVLLFLLPSGVLKRVLRIVAPYVLVGIISLFFGEAVFGVRTKIVFIDVGQGDSILCLIDGKSVLIDGGVYESGGIVEGVLNYYGIKGPDYVIVTHWDEDHYGGIRYLYERGRVNTIYSSSYNYEFNSVQLINRGDKLVFPDGVLTCISPVVSSGEGSFDSNDISVVMELQSNDKKILFTGDIPFEIEDKLIEDGVLSDVDILKVAHHGSRYSTSSNFLNIAKPEYSVISVGKYNSYGHPSIEAINRLKRAGSQIIDTRDNGAITIDIYKDSYKITSYKK